MNWGMFFYVVLIFFEGKLFGLILVLESGLLFLIMWGESVWIDIFD